jgi:hypothetical protein
MSYRDRHNNDGNKTLTFQFPSGDQFTLGIDDGDTVSSLKRFIQTEKLGDLRVEDKRLRVVFMKGGKHVVLDDSFRLDLDEDITMPGGDKEKISDGEITVVVHHIDPDEIISKLEEIKKFAADKTEINKLIEEIPAFIEMDREQRREACGVVAARVADLERASDSAFDRFNSHQNIDNDQICRLRLEHEEDEKERMGEQRTCQKGYFLDNEQDALRMMEDLADEILYQDGTYEDIKEDLHILLDNYRRAVRYSGHVFWVNMMINCLERPQ